MTVTDERASTGAAKPFVVISSDTHVGLPAFTDFTPYVDAAHREDYAAWCKQRGNQLFSMMAPTSDDDNAALDANTMFARNANRANAIADDDPVRRTFKQIMTALGVEPDVVDEWAKCYTSENISGGADSAKRLRLLEEQGVVGEVCIPGAALDGLVPGGLGGPTPDIEPGLVWAMCQAYNRWLAEFCAGAPGRRAGAIMIDPKNLDRTIDEMRWAREAGMFGGILLPQMSLPSGLPGYADGYWDPLWSAAEDLDMVLNLHVGGTASDSQLYSGDPRGSMLISRYEQFWVSRRPMWFMVLGGVFERHPRLKLSIIENRCEWVPDTLDEMSTEFLGFGRMKDRSHLSMTPREYFERNVFLGASIMNRSTAEKRRQIGVQNIMWGGDYPHPEGATPFLRKAMQYQFGGLPEEDLRPILGGNIAKVYGFDMLACEKAAATCGPTLEELATPLPASAVPPHASPVYTA
jgi:predicted TIM-barrel fold metal-dependent hydrolase